MIKLGPCFDAKLQQHCSSLFKVIKFYCKLLKKKERKKAWKPGLTLVLDKKKLLALCQVL